MKWNPMLAAGPAAVGAVGAVAAHDLRQKRHAVTRHSGWTSLAKEHSLEITRIMTANAPATESVPHR